MSNAVPLLDSTEQLIQGEVIEDGCDFHFSLSRQAHEPAKVLRPVAVDTAKCLALVEVGTPAVIDELYGSSDSDQLLSETAAVPNNWLRARAAAGVNVWDPIYTRVNFLHVYIVFDYDGNMVNYAWDGKESGYFAASGWERIYSEGVTWSQPTYYEVRARSSERFRNETFSKRFCLDDRATMSDLLDVTAIGYADGSTTGFANYRVYGGCSHLLDAEIWVN